MSGLVIVILMRRIQYMFSFQLIEADSLKSPLSVFWKIGEARFMSAVAKRLENLGALTKGDRRAASGTQMLEEFNLDTPVSLRLWK